MRCITPLKGFQMYVHWSRFNYENILKLGNILNIFYYINTYICMSF